VNKEVPPDISKMFAAALKEIDQQGINRWVRRHKTRIIDLLVRQNPSLVQAQVRREHTNPQIFKDIFEQAFLGAVRAARRGEPTPTDVPMIDGVIDVRPSVRHDISDAARDAPAPQPTKPSTDGVTPKPKPEAQHTRRAAPTAVVGLYAASVLGEGAPVDYGRNWSQSPAYPGRRFP
jgi:hypothetical protein